MGNAYRKLTDSALNTTIGATTSILIENYLQYGVSEAEVEQLDALNFDLATNISVQATLEAAKLAGTQAKLDSRELVIDAAYNLIDKIYANPAVDDEALLKANLAPRPTHSSAKPLQQVTGLLATASANGDVLLKWNRSGNTPTVTFVVEAQSAPSGPFNFAVSTTRTRITLSGYEPGQTVTFRVRATRTSASSAPSNLATIYGNGSYALSIAA